MEFYYNLCPLALRLLPRFNSQRDGILPDLAEKYGIEKARFNSQRDGILLLSSDNIGMTQRFQFPTGWNSTQNVLERAMLELKFQFPTGWNSTFIKTYSMPHKIVSIPNGMEFYIGTLMIP